MMKFICICSFAICLYACSTNASKKETNSQVNDTTSKQLMIDATVNPEINEIPINKIYSNNDFSLTYSSVYTLTEHGRTASSGGTLYELSIKGNEMNFLYITIDKGECNYQELYDLSLKTYTDSYISSTPMLPITISDIEGKVFNIKCEYQNITVFVIPTEYYTIMFQLFSNNEQDYNILYAIIKSFSLH